MGEKTATGLPDLSPTKEFKGLTVGDKIQLRWMNGTPLVDAEVLATSRYGALVLVRWAPQPYEMYVTQQCADGAWAR